MYTLKLKGRYSYAKFDKKYGLSAYKPPEKPKSSQDLQTVQERLSLESEEFKRAKPSPVGQVQDSNFTRVMYFLNL